MRWRREAFNRLPEFRKFLQEDKSPYTFLGDLVARLESAYQTGNEDLVKRIYGLVFWCMNAPREKNAEDDLLTIVTCAFLEHLPQHKLIRHDLGRWFQRRDVLAMTEIFRHHGTEAEFQEMLASCDVKR